MWLTLFSRNRFIEKSKISIPIPDFEKVKVNALHATYFYHYKKVDCASVFNMQYSE